MADANPLRKVKTPPFRMSFPHLLEPRKEVENGVEKINYQLSMLFPPGTDMSALNAALAAAMSDKYGADKSKWPKLKHGPKDVLKDFAEYNNGRDKPMPGDWAGWTMVRCSATAKNPPAVVGPVKGPDGKFPTIKDPREVYPGRWARATIDAYVYERKDGKGVTFGLANVQLLKHDTKFGNAVSDANKDFDDAPEEWRDGADDFGTRPSADTGNDWD